MNGFADTKAPTNPSGGSGRSSRRIVGSTTAVLALLAVSACGSATAGKDGSRQPSTADAPRAAIAVTYEAHAKGSDGPYSSHTVLIAAGQDRVRLEIESTGMAPMLFVYDGRRLLVHDAEGYRPWSLFEAPEEHPDQFQAVSDVYADPDSAEFAEGCRSPTVVGHKPHPRSQCRRLPLRDPALCGRQRLLRPRRLARPEDRAADAIWGTSTRPPSTSTPTSPHPPSPRSRPAGPRSRCTPPRSDRTDPSRRLPPSSSSVLRAGALSASPTTRTSRWCSRSSPQISSSIPAVRRAPVVWMRCSSSNGSPTAAPVRPF